MAFENCEMRNFGANISSLCEPCVDRILNSDPWFSFNLQLFVLQGVANFDYFLNL